MRFQRQQCNTPGSILLDEKIIYIIHADITVRFGFCNVLAWAPGSPRACASACDFSVISYPRRLSADFDSDMCSVLLYKFHRRTCTSRIRTSCLFGSRYVRNPKVAHFYQQYLTLTSVITKRLIF
jgi:hypothetical protein